MDLNNVNDTIGNHFGLFGVSEDHLNETHEIFDSKTSSYDLNNDKSVCDTIDVNTNHCGICKSNGIKYRCPACDRRTCSLRCCKRHKKAFNCSGIREKTPFIKLSDFEQTQFLSDFHFLDDVERIVDGSVRERHTMVKYGPIIPKKLTQLIRAAESRGTHLKLLPAAFQKRLQNRTAFSIKKNEMYWYSEWKFCVMRENHSKEMDFKSDDRQYVTLKESLSETLIISQIINSILVPKELKYDNPKLIRQLSHFRDAGINEISVLIKLEGSPLNDAHFIELDIHESLRHNLKGKTIIEFPTFIIILKQFKHLFNIDNDINDKTI